MSKTKGIIYAIISAISFGLIPFFSVPLLHNQMHTASILFYRNAFCVPILAIVCLVNKRQMKIPPKMLINFVILSILYVISSWALVYSYKFIASGLSTTIHYLYPIAVAILMILFFKEKKSIKIFFSAVLALIGVALLCNIWKASINIKGVAFAFLTVISYSCYIVYLNKTTANKITHDVLLLYLLITHSILFAAVSFISMKINGLPTQHTWFGIDSIMNKTSLLYALGLALISSILASFMLLAAIKRVGPTTNSIIGSLETVVSMIVGMICFSETYNWISFVGLVIIILSVCTVILNNKAKKQVPAYAQNKTKGK